MTTEFYATPAFPVSKALQWTPPEQLELTSTQTDWLLYEGSLTERLKQVGQQFSVKLLGQQLLAPNTEEKQRLKGKDQVVIREVLLYCNEKPWVFAPRLLDERAS